MCKKQSHGCHKCCTAWIIYSHLFKTYIHFSVATLASRLMTTLAADLALTCNTTVTHLLLWLVLIQLFGNKWAGSDAFVCIIWALNRCIYHLFVCVLYPLLYSCHPYFLHIEFENENNETNASYRRFMAEKRIKHFSIFILSHVGYILQAIWAEPQIHFIYSHVIELRISNFRLFQFFHMQSIHRNIFVWHISSIV